MAATALNLIPEFERAMLALAMREPELWRSIVQHIEPDAVGSANAKRVLEALRAMHESGFACTSSVALVQYIATADDGRVSRKDLVAFAHDVQSWAVPQGFTMQQVVDVMTPVLRLRLDHKIAITAAKAIANPDSHRAVRELVSRRDQIGVSVSSRAVELTGAFSAVRELRTTERLTFGVPELDQATDGGLWLGAFGLIIGGYGGGKSIMLSQLAASSFLSLLPTVIVTLELPPAMQYARWLSCITGVPSKLILDGSCESEARERLDVILAALGGGVAPFAVLELPRGAKPSEVFDEIDRYEQRAGSAVRTMVLDYLDEMEPDKTAASDYKAMKVICQQIANWAGKGRVQRFAWSASQAQRLDKSYGSGKGQTKRITGDNVADSINKMRVVDLAVAVNVDEAQQFVEYHLSKYRLGAANRWIGPLPVNFALGRMGGFDVPVMSTPNAR